MPWQTSRSVLILASLFLHLSEAAGQASDKPTSTADQASTPSLGAQPFGCDLDRAKHHFDQGVRFFEKGDDHSALAEFEASYLLCPIAPTLENIGLTQKKLDRYPEAVTSLQRYLETAKKITPEKIAQTRALIDEMRARLADVTLTITPDAATVAIDGRSVGSSPLATLTLAAGRHELEVNAPEHEPLRRGFLVIAGEPLALALHLKPIPRLGQLHITALPATAMIRIDGVLYGTGKVEAALPPGGHTLEVNAPGYRVQRSELILAAGQSHSQDIRLEALPKKVPLHRRAWLWPVIAAVAGGAATAIAVPLATRPESPIPGDIGTTKVE
jgi:hypothetical protein